MIASLEVDLEDGLVRLEDHSGVHLEVLVKVHPSAVRAGLATVAVSKHPCLLLLEELDRRLVLGEKAVTDADVALRGPANNYSLALVLVVIDFAG